MNLRTARATVHGLHGTDPFSHTMMRALQMASGRYRDEHKEWPAPWREAPDPITGEKVVRADPTGLTVHFVFGEARNGLTRIECIIEKKERAPRKPRVHRRRIVIKDGCLRQVYRYEDDPESTQRIQPKRRPRAYTDRPKACSWCIPCADHPSMSRQNARLAKAGKQWRLENPS